MPKKITVSKQSRRKPRARELIRERAADAPVIYANSVNIGTSLFDISLGFGQIEESTPKRLVVTETLRVIMSPQHAKELSRLLGEQVQGYEDRFGPLPAGPVVEIQEGPARA